MNFDQKIFWFPESYNRLREELSTHWLDETKHPYWLNAQCGWAMAFDAELFVEYMNRHLGGVLKVIALADDQLKMDYICSTFLKELRRRRGERA